MNFLNINTNQRFAADFYEPESQFVARYTNQPLNLTFFVYKRKSDGMFEVKLRDTIMAEVTSESSARNFVKNYHK